MGAYYKAKSPYFIGLNPIFGRFTFRLFISVFSIVGLDLERFCLSIYDYRLPGPPIWSKMVSAPNAPLRTSYVSLLFKNFISKNSLN